MDMKCFSRALAVCVILTTSRPLWAMSPDTDFNVRAVKKAAAQGDVDAQLLLGQSYLDGQGVPKDSKEAVAWYRKAAEQGNVQGQLRLALAYQDGNGTTKNSAEAVKWYRKAAEQGHAGGQYALASAYQAGDGVMRNSAEAVRWYRKAAEQGHDDAQAVLGSMYEAGQGVAQNFAEAAKWYRKAAEQGYAEGQYNLGKMYEFGRGVPKDDVESYTWFILAAAQDDWLSRALKRTPTDESAREHMALLGNRMTKEQLAAAQKRAALFSPTATDEFSAIEAEFRASQSPGAPRHDKEPPPVKRQPSVDAPSFSLTPNPNNFALVIGIEKYQKLPAAQFAEHDAGTMRRYLLGMGYPERNIIYLNGENATRSRLSSYLDEWLPKNVNGDSTVFVYFSGHGAPNAENKQAYLMPWDGDAQFLKSTAYPLSQLYVALNQLKVKKRIVVLDSCFSGSGGRSVLAKGTRPLVPKVTASGDLGSVVLFAAASEDEVTGTLEDQGHGVFTYYLLRGLAGEAKGPSGTVTAKGLYRYLKPLVQDAARRQNREQTPLLGGAQQDIELANFK